MTQDWCDLCELPLSQCPHGAPSPPSAPRSAQPPPARTPRRAAEPRTPRRATAAVTTRAPAGVRTPPGRTPQADFRSHLLAVLAEHPVAVEREEVLAALGERMAFTEADRGITAEGEVRWRRTAQKERKAMADDGLVDSAGHARWVLSPAGRDEAASRDEAVGDAAVPGEAE